MNKAKRFSIEFICFIILIILDQYTKYLAVNHLKDTSGIPIIKNVLELYYLPNGNTGAAFGMLSGHQLLFTIIALTVVLIIGYILYNMPLDKKYYLMSILMLFIAAGGIGNMIDRVKQNYVVDFVYFSLINFPIFNVADIYVSVSTVILAIYLIFIIKEEDYDYIQKEVKKPLIQLFRKNKWNNMN